MSSLFTLYLAFVAGGEDRERETAGYGDRVYCYRIALFAIMCNCRYPGYPGNGIGDVLTSRLNRLPLPPLSLLNDVAHCTAWRELLDDGTKRRFKVVLVFKLDRAFRSVKHMHDTLHTWEAVGIAFKSLREQFDTSTALGRLLLNLLASLAEFELEQTGDFHAWLPSLS